MPFVAELLQLFGRSVAAGYALVLGAVGLGCVVGRWRTPAGSLPKNQWEEAVPPGEVVAAGKRGVSALAVVGVVALVFWLGAAALVSTRLYHQLPHILDAVSYTFQAGLFATGQLSLPAPPIPDAFKGPFEVVWQGRIFSQYPPGASAIYAIGQRLDIEWLVGPLACAALIGATAWTARALYGAACGLAVLALGMLSPFILFQAGSYLSHPVVGGLLAGGLAAFVAGERSRNGAWFGVCGGLLGAAFVGREAASVLFALPLGVRLLWLRRWHAFSLVVAFGLPFLLAYLVYNARQTGSPLLLPRTIFDAADHFGFGNGIGFHTRHTLAAGLANTDELLTLLQFEVSGWPPLFALGLLALPFLAGRPQAWDFMALGGFLAFVVAYVGYFYHGIALGPRYYFEAMPWLLLLGGRGAQTLAGLARTWLAPVVLLGLLSLNTLLFYTPAELARRTDLGGQPNGARVTLDFVAPSLSGPQLEGVPTPSLVLTDNWWTYNTALAALNCPRLPECPVLFALATNAQDADRLRAQYPGRTVLRAEDNGGDITLAPY